MTLDRLRAVLAALALAATASLACAADPGAQPVLVDGPTSDASASVALSVGDVLEVRLRGNATTGFEWDVVPPVLAALVQRGDAVYVEDANPQHAAGIGGTWVFTFDVVAPGTGMLSFAYARPWETVPPAQTFDVQVGAS